MNNPRHDGGLDRLGALFLAFGLADGLPIDA
jgi:hypothetical protein